MGNFASPRGFRGVVEEEGRKPGTHFEDSPEEGGGEDGKAKVQKAICR